VDEHDEDRSRRVLPFKRPEPAAEPAPQASDATVLDGVTLDRDQVGPRELRVVIENFLGILESFDLYVQQTQSLATLWLKGGEPDADAVSQIVANCGHDAARLQEIRASYRRLADALDDPSHPGQA